MVDSNITLQDWLALLSEPAIVLTASGDIVAANAAFGRLVGSKVAGRRLQDLVIASEDEMADHLRLWSRNKRPIVGALRMESLTGGFAAGIHAGRLSGVDTPGATPLLLARFKRQQEVTEAFRTLTEQVEALTREVFTRKRAEQDLLALKESLEERVANRTAQLRALATRLIEAEESERRRLAHALHDNLQQLLVSASFQIDRLEGVSDIPKAHNIAHRLRDLIHESIAVSRSLTLDLSPPVLHDAGLCAGLAWLGRRTLEQHDLEVEIRADQTAEPDDEETRIALFTAARELIFNVVKHAHARKAAIELDSVDERSISLRVSDQGAGFDLAEVEMNSKGDGFGLFSLRERAEFLGGQFRIETAPGKGTTVEIIVPRRTEKAPASTSTAEIIGQA
ncbi:hypothetical protein BH23BAC4_BH23BAC4_17250 [soil metagenome]